MTGRDVARRLISGGYLRGQPQEVGGLPTTPELLREITGDTWQRLDVPPAGAVAVYFAIAGDWDETFPSSDAPYWEDGFLFATRHQGWLILYGALPEEEREEERIRGPAPFGGWMVFLTHPEMDIDSAERVSQFLWARDIDISALKLESPLMPFIFHVNADLSAAEIVHRHGLLDARYLAFLDAPPGSTSRSRARWIWYTVGVTKGVAALLREMEP